MVIVEIGSFRVIQTTIRLNIGRISGKFFRNDQIRHMHYVSNLLHHSEIQTPFLWLKVAYKHHVSGNVTKHMIFLEIYSKLLLL